MSDESGDIEAWTTHADDAGVLHAEKASLGEFVTVATWVRWKLKWTRRVLALAVIAVLSMVIGLWAFNDASKSRAESSAARSEVAETKADAAATAAAVAKFQADQADKEIAANKEHIAEQASLIAQECERNNSIILGFRTFIAGLQIPAESLVKLLAAFDADNPLISCTAVTP